MSNYSKTTDFEAKDSLPTGDSGKIIRGAEFETEFDAISTAIGTKADTAGPTFTGTLTFETISDGTIGVTAFVDEDNMSSNSATLVPTQQSVKAYVDAQVTAQDLDFQADSGGALSIDLDSESLTFTGGTGVDTSGSGNAVTFAIDSTVTTLTGSQTLTNKTLTSPDVNTPDIDGGTIDGTVIGGATPAAVSATTVSATGNITVGGTVDGRDVATDGTKLDGIEASATADQTAAEIRTLVESASDSNVFTDADHTKLNAIEASATADQTDAEIRAAVEAATDSNVFTDADHTKLNAIEASADVTDTANVTAAGALMDSELTDITAVKSLNQGVATTDSPTFAGLATTANVTFGDNDKALFGAGSDLQIYHDGSNSYIAEGGTGNLQIQAQNLSLEDSAGTRFFLGIQGGETRLYNQGNEKVAVTSTGIDVTGSVVSDGLTVNSGATDEVARFEGTGSPYIAWYDTGVRQAYVGSFGNNFSIVGDTPDTTVSIATGGTNRVTVASTGIDVTGTVTADGLTVDGDGTIQSNASSSVPTLTLKDTDASISVGQSLGRLSFSSADASPDAAGERAYVRGYLIDGTNYGIDIGAMASGGSPTKRLTVSGSGDISFYEDTGTTAKLFWDASAERLGIGTTSPYASLTVDTANGILNIASGNTSGGTKIQAWGATQSDGYLAIEGNTKEYMRIDSSGNVGIGTSSPARTLHVSSGSLNDTARFESTDTEVTLELKDSTGTAKIKSRADFRFETGSTPSEAMRIDSSGVVIIKNDSAPTLRIDNTDTSLTSNQTIGDIDFYQNDPSGGGVGVVSKIRSINSSSFQGEAGLAFHTGTTSGLTERMRIDSSGNLLVGKTGTTLGTAGIENRADGRITSTRSGNTNLVLNRLSSDGSLIDFYKDGTTVGSIGSEGGDTLYIGTSDTGLRFHSADRIVPHNPSTNVARDAAIDLGRSSERFKDLYLSNNIVASGASSPTLNLKDTTNNCNILVYAQNSTSHVGTYSNHPLVFDTNSTGRARIDTSGNFLVGRTSVGTSGTGHSIRGGDSAVFARAGGEVAIFSRSDSNGEILRFDGNGSAGVGSIGTDGSNVYIGTGDTTLKMDAGSNGIFPRGTGGVQRDAGIQLGSAGNRFTDLYLSGGVYLGGTGSANKLDDYEEGDYDVTVTCGTSGTITLNSSFNRAQYTKVGRTVHVSGFLVVSSVSSPVGYFTLNLPFTPANLTDRAADSTASLVIQGIVSANISDFMGTINEGQALIYVQLGDNNTIQNDSAQQMQANSYIAFSATYAAA